MKHIYADLDGQDDITEAVQILYDIAHSSMDWGSGFLDNEEMATVVRLAVLMGWEVPDLPGSDSALASVAREFPDHYKITERKATVSVFRPDGIYYDVTRKETA